MISYAEYLEMMARTAKKPEPCKNGVSKESDLHEQIINYCKSKNIPWIPVHSRMDRAHTNAVGTVDFIIAASVGRTFWVECKKKGGKLSPSQNATIHWLQALGHSAHCVSSMTEFLEIVK